MTPFDFIIWALAIAVAVVVVGFAIALAVLAIRAAAGKDAITTISEDMARTDQSDAR